MRAYLHSHFRVSGTKLLDTYLSSSYTLSADAVWLLTVLQRKVDTRLATAFVMKEKNLDYADARSAVYELLAQLMSYGAVRLEERQPYWRLASWMRTKQRYTPSVWHCVCAVARAYGLICLLLCVPYLIIRLMSGADGYFGWYISIPLLLFLSLICHELGHMIWAKARGVTTVFIAGLGYVGLLHSKTNITDERYIALAGPLTAALGCVLLGIGIRQEFLQIILLGMGCLHLLHLLPFSADGKALWRKHEAI